MKIAHIGGYEFLVMMDLVNLCHPECNIRHGTDNLTKRIGNRIRAEASGSYLVQQGLKSMVIVPVEHINTIVIMTELFSQFKAGKSAAHDHDHGIFKVL